MYIYIYILHAAIYDYSCSTIVRARRGIYRARRNIRRGRTTDGNFDTRRGASRQSNEFHVREIPLSGGRERERGKKRKEKEKNWWKRKLSSANKREQETLAR